MPAYVVVHAERRREDMFVEDPALTLTIRDGWAILADAEGIAVALPAEHVACIQRIDEDPEPEEQKPAPNEE